VIVAAAITQQVNDKQQLVPMIQAVQKNTGEKPAVITADCGYWDTNSLQDPLMRGIEVLVAPDSQPQPPGATLPASAPNNDEAKRMREVLATDSGKAKYRLRKAVIEPVFGQIKEVRGLRRFRHRGLERVDCEWKLICATHNLLKLYRHRYPKPQPRKKSRANATLCNHGRFRRPTVSPWRARHSGLIAGAARLSRMTDLCPTGSQAVPALRVLPESSQLPTVSFLSNCCKVLRSNLVPHCKLLATR
jgi:hypothetical protein